MKIASLPLQWSKGTIHGFIFMDIMNFKQNKRILLMCSRNVDETFLTIVLRISVHVQSLNLETIVENQFGRLGLRIGKKIVGELASNVRGRSTLVFPELINSNLYRLYLRLPSPFDVPCLCFCRMALGIHLTHISLPI